MDNDHVGAWWQRKWTQRLTIGLSHINRSRLERQAYYRFGFLFDALNQIWDDYYFYRKLSGELAPGEQSRIEEGKVPTDDQTFPQLLLSGLKEDQQRELCIQQSVSELALLPDKIQDHQTLRKLSYDPGNPVSELEEEAKKQHEEFSEEFRKYRKAIEAGRTKSPKELLKKLARILYVIRCNHRHGGKLPCGPLPVNQERDEEVCTIASAVIVELVEGIFDCPERKLAVYGTLRREESNHGVIADIDGEWTSGTAKGEVDSINGYPVFRWMENGKKIEVDVLISDALRVEYSRIDQFEGKNYVRHLVPVQVNGLFHVCNIYEGIGSKIGRS